MSASWHIRAALWIFGLLLAGVSVASAAPPVTADATVTDRRWAEVLGETLFWDTVQVISRTNKDSGKPVLDAAQVSAVLLAQHSLERYRWLIEHAFDQSLWQGPDDSQLRANFTLMWRLATGLYESTLGSGQAALRVCRPDEDSDEFKCDEEAEPVRMVPIPSQGPALIPANAPVSG